jgi:Rrf2 family cysteine metabolism transcriptional repressor
MNISQKCQYALRAMFELARRGLDKPVSISQLATAQAIPHRFLEQILGELKRGGFVESRRGVRGGYLLAHPPTMVSAGDIIRFIDGPMDPVQCSAVTDSDHECPLQVGCVFVDLWQEARDAAAAVYDRATLQSLVDAQRDRDGQYVASYTI